MHFDRLKTLSRQLSAALVLPFILSGCVTSNQHTVTTEPLYMQADESAEALVLAYGLIRKHYVGQTSPARLVSAAIAGMEEMLASQNQALTKPAIDVQAIAENKQAAEALSAAVKHYSTATGVNHQTLEHADIRGMVQTLDAGTAFMPPDVYQEVQIETKERFGGVGLQIGVKDNHIVVIAPIEGTPAEKAGIKAGDHLAIIDGVATKNLNLMETVQRLRGPIGSTMTLTIERTDVFEPMLYSLTRQIIKIESVKSKILEGNIGYIRLTQFNAQTGKDLSMALKQLRQPKTQSLIIDLRNNPGGLLTSAIEVSEQFVGLNGLIVYIKTRDGKKDEYPSHMKDQSEAYPMVVLVNQGSAAASEIVAGALQDWKRATVIGTPTFGRGTVQTIIPLHDGSGLRLTTAKTYTPKGRAIEDKIQPDLIVEEKEGEDTVLAAALEKLKAASIK